MTELAFKPILSVCTNAAGEFRFLLGGTEAIARLEGMLSTLIGLPDKVERNSNHINRIYGGIAIIVFLTGLVGFKVFV